MFKIRELSVKECQNRRFLHIYWNKKLQAVKAQK